MTLRELLLYISRHRPIIDADEVLALSDSFEEHGQNEIAIRLRKQVELQGGSGSVANFIDLDQPGAFPDTNYSIYNSAIEELLLANGIPTYRAPINGRRMTRFAIGGGTISARPARPLSLEQIMSRMLPSLPRRTDLVAESQGVNNLHLQTPEDFFPPPPPPEDFSINLPPEPIPQSLQPANPNVPREVALPGTMRELRAARNAIRQRLDRESTLRVTALGRLIEAQQAAPFRQTDRGARNPVGFGEAAQRVITPDVRIATNALARSVSTQVALEQRTASIERIIANLNKEYDRVRLGVRVRPQLGASVRYPFFFPVTVEQARQAVNDLLAETDRNRLDQIISSTTTTVRADTQLARLRTTTELIHDVQLSREGLAAQARALQSRPGTIVGPTGPFGGYESFEAFQAANRLRRLANIASLPGRIIRAGTTEVRAQARFAPIRLAGLFERVSDLRTVAAVGFTSQLIDSLYPNPETVRLPTTSDFFRSPQEVESIRRLAMEGHYLRDPRNRSGVNLPFALAGDTFMQTGAAFNMVYHDLTPFLTRPDTVAGVSRYAAEQADAARRTREFREWLQTPAGRRWNRQFVGPVQMIDGFPVLPPPNLEDIGGPQVGHVNPLQAFGEDAIFVPARTLEDYYRFVFNL